jgi:hypothetical protein
MDKLNVNGHPDLVRDTKSNAVINKNESEYNSYLESYKLRQSEKYRVSKVENDLSELKTEINEIKDLLTKLIDK